MRTEELKDFIFLLIIMFLFNEVLFLLVQLLALDPESVIERGKEAMFQNQKLIDEAVDQSYEVALGAGLFGRCLVTKPNPHSLIFSLSLSLIIILTLVSFFFALTHSLSL